MNVPILFLDVDGVLNSRRYWMRAEREGFIVLDPDAVARVLGLLDRSGAKVVLSSTWRHYPDMCAALNAAGITWVDKTPLVGFNHRSSATRGAEIGQWLSENPHITHFAIVDDDSSAGSTARLARRFVQTSWEHGILDKHVKRLESLLRA